MEAAPNKILAETKWKLCWLTFDLFFVCATSMHFGGVSLQFETTELCADEDLLHFKNPIDYQGDALTYIDA